MVTRCVNIACGTRSRWGKISDSGRCVRVLKTPPDTMTTCNATPRAHNDGGKRSYGPPHTTSSRAPAAQMREATARQWQTRRKSTGHALHRHGRQVEGKHTRADNTGHVATASASASRGGRAKRHVVVIADGAQGVLSDLAPTRSGGGHSQAQSENRTIAGGRRNERIGVDDGGAML
jgi:hypothetical protein